MKIFFILFRAFASVDITPAISLLYLFSGMVRFILQYVIRYRRRSSWVTRRSLHEKTPDEIRNISNCYYRNLADIIVEVVKMQRISPEALLERCSLNGLSI